MRLKEQRGCRQWAQETFGDLEVGSRRRTRRLVAVAKALAVRPAGRVTDVFDDMAEREGAYRLLSNAALPPGEVSEAMCMATVRLCSQHKRVYVPIDGSSLLLTDRKKSRGLGGVGTWKGQGRGLQVVTALALDEQGTPLGVCAQTWWARQPRVDHRKNELRKLETKETRFSRATLDATVRRLREHAPDTVVVSVMDRGFDCWPVLQTAAEGARFIVRFHQNRRLASGRFLRPTLMSQPARGLHRVEVPARLGREARTARVQLRAMQVQLELHLTRRRKQYVAVNAVLAQEVAGPKGASLSWLLLTTEPIKSLEQIRQIVRGYTYRWRIEELHRLWKRGGGHVEDTQLRSRDAIEKWATLHCAVAARAMRLTQLARTHPELPSTDEFSQVEIDATIVLRGKRTKRQLGDVPPLGEMVRMIADLGGYTGKSSGGPPGPTVIRRGLERIGVAVEVLDALRKKPRKVTNG